jgi:hypothetical protein
MRLRTRQRWVLATMERNLRASEPRLSAMFAMFARLSRDEAPSGAEPISPHHRRGRPRLWAYALVACVAVALAGLGVALPNTGSRSCGLAGFTPPGSGTSSSSTCSQPPRRAVPKLGGR